MKIFQKQQDDIDRAAASGRKYFWSINHSSQTLSNMKTIEVDFTHIDNQAIIYVNGVKTWDSGTINNDPLLNQRALITQNWRPGENELRIEGINQQLGPGGYNPYHFQYTVYDGPEMLAQVMQKSGNGNLNHDSTSAVASTTLSINI